MSLLLEDWKQSLVLKNVGKLLAALKGSALIKLSRVLSEMLMISRAGVEEAYALVRQNKMLVGDFVGNI